MSAANYDLRIDQGSDFSMTLTFKDTESNKINLTGFTFDGQIRSQFSNPTVIAEFDFDILDQDNPLTLGQLRVSLPGSTSTAIVVPSLPLTPNSTSRPVTRFIYDIESEFAGVKKRWMQGAINLSPEVTRV